jgi:hypothetical protein
LLLFLSGHAQAHPLDVGLLDVRDGSGRISVSLQLNPLEAARLAEIALPPPVNWVSVFEPRIFFATLGKAAPRLDGQDCPWRNPRVRRESGAEGAVIRVSAQAVCPEGKNERAGSFSLPLPLLEKATGGFRVIAKIELMGKVSSSVGNRERPFVASSPGFGAFVALGAEHIGLARGQWFGESGLRLPEGLDHILFVIALVLGSLSWLNALKAVTGFTLGHSLTLLLSSFGWLSAPARFVESGIAFSIACTAMLVLLGKRNAHSWKLAAVFGLVHGLGFASALRDLNLSRGSLVEGVFGFNLGVELAQLVIALLVLGIFLVLATKSAAAHWITLKVSASAIALSGVYWAFERMFA